jgi:hypothetical protein
LTRRGSAAILKEKGMNNDKLYYGWHSGICN